MSDGARSPEGSRQFNPKISRRAFLRTTLIGGGLVGGGYVVNQATGGGLARTAWNFLKELGKPPETRFFENIDTVNPAEISQLQEELVELEIFFRGNLSFCRLSNLNGIRRSKIL